MTYKQTNTERQGLSHRVLLDAAKSIHASARCCCASMYSAVCWSCLCMRRAASAPAAATCLTDVLAALRRLLRLEEPRLELRLRPRGSGVVVSDGRSESSIAATVAPSCVITTASLLRRSRPVGAGAALRHSRRTTLAMTSA